MITPSCSRLAPAVAALFACVSLADAAHFGRRFPSEKCIFQDKITGVDVVALTTDPANDAKIYQTHAQWTADGQWIVFRSNRGAPAPTPTPVRHDSRRGAVGGTDEARVTLQRPRVRWVLYNGFCSLPIKVPGVMEAHPAPLRGATRCP